jgi:hypothetical protein
MQRDQQSSTSRFLFERLNLSITNSLTLSQKFIFSFFHKAAKFETILQILFSAFQLNLIQNPEEFTAWIPK